MVFWCCVPSCSVKGGEGIVLHRFPKDQVLFTQWLEAVDNANLYELNRSVVYSNYRVCHNHFHENVRIACGRRGSYLQYNAVSTENLGLHRKDSNATTSALTCEEPTTFTTDSATDFNDSTSAPICEEPLTFATGSATGSQVSAALGAATFHNNKRKSAGVPNLKVTFKTSRRGIRERSNLIKSFNVTKISHLPIQSQQLCKIARSLKSTAKRLDRELATTKQRLKEAEQCLNTDFMNLKLNKTSYTFLMGQLKHQMTSPRARRYSILEKIFALALLKQSPKAYKFLQLVFALPSKKTLLNLPNQVPFEDGINAKIFLQLSATVLKMEPQHRYCVIIFDEISLEPSIQYNCISDELDGFQDNGNVKIPVIADKALVYMSPTLKLKLPFLVPVVASET
ncbi:uncharacterized protein LOC116165459 [Photinus pyralis]|uniref:uncharacterized protein LOC116165459 n=1 Tax=Photinus pyralis TaxID=7054 RepID=UPI00126750C8|nr:uncharacterized protein LOC116165459 [Photinus pyralis]